jgi:hypothetical protein
VRPDANLSIVMPGLVPGIRALAGGANKGVDGRDKPGHDGTARSAAAIFRYGTNYQDKEAM